MEWRRNVNWKTYSGGVETILALTVLLFLYSMSDYFAICSLIWTNIWHGKFISSLGLSALKPAPESAGVMFVLEHERRLSLNEYL